MPIAGEKPVEIVEGLVRSEDQLRLFKDTVVESTTDTYESESVNAGPYREFLLHLDIDSTGSPTTLRVEVQFASQVTGKWHTLKQGLFAALFWEDTDVASGVYECFRGQCAGRQLRVKLTGVGVSSSAYFTVSASVEFRN